MRLRNPQMRNGTGQSSDDYSEPNTGDSRNGNSHREKTNQMIEQGKTMLQKKWLHNRTRHQPNRAPQRVSPIFISPTYIKKCSLSSFIQKIWSQFELKILSLNLDHDLSLDSYFRQLRI